MDRRPKVAEWRSRDSGRCDPAAVRPADLFVDKLIVRLPLNNPGAPVKGYSEEPQTIVDDRALFYYDWSRRQ